MRCFGGTAARWSMSLLGILVQPSASNISMTAYSCSKASRFRLAVATFCCAIKAGTTVKNFRMSPRVGAAVVHPPGQTVVQSLQYDSLNGGSCGGLRGFAVVFGTFRPWFAQDLKLILAHW